MTRIPGARRRFISVLALTSTVAAACSLQAPDPQTSGAAGSGPVGGAANGAGATGNGAASSSTSPGAGTAHGGAAAPTGGGTRGGGAGGSGAATGGPLGGASSNPGASGAASDCEPACTGTSECDGGECQCKGGLAYCDGQCVDTQSDSQHCGSECGVACTGGQSCVDGACTCGDKDPCAGACVDTRVDDANCGSCGMGCAALHSCSEGHCQCQVGLTSCGSTCVDQKTDAHNCGSCNTTCQGAADCVNGSCKACSTGCAVLTTTVTDSSSYPYMAYAIHLSQAVDLSRATIVARLYVASSYQPSIVRIHYQDTTDASSTGVLVGSPVVASGWFEAAAGGIAGNTNTVHADLIEVLLGFDPSTDPGTAVVYLDSISITTAVAGPWNFATSASPLAASPDHDVVISGNVTWRNN